MMGVWCSGAGGNINLSTGNYQSDDGCGQVWQGINLIGWYFDVYALDLSRPLAGLSFVRGLPFVGSLFVHGWTARGSLLFAV